MGWDASRPVPWRRLIKEWLVYATIMVVAFAVLFSGDAGMLGIIGGLLASGPLYLGLGYVLAKFGYQRKTLAEMRTPRASSGPEPESAAEQRSRPAPTRRTSTGSNRPAAKSKKR